MAHLTLLAVAIAGLAYFTFRRRPVDFFTLGYLSSVLYFLPGIVGYTLSPATPEQPVKLPIELVPEAYAIMATVLAATLTATLVWDRLHRPLAATFTVQRDLWLAGPLALVLAIAGMAMTWVASDGTAFAADKQIVIRSVGRWHVLWEMAGSWAVLFGYVQRNRVVFVGGLLLLSVDMFIGFRFAFAMAILAIAMLWARRLGQVSMSQVPKSHLMLMLVFGLFVVSYQNLKEPLRNHDWSEIANRLSSPGWYGLGVLTSEPFTTQTVLNEIVKRDYHTGGDHLWAAGNQFILFSSELGAEDHRFGDQFQPELFPLVDHGLANNIWAQMWSAGGWPLLLVFIGVYVLVLMLGSHLWSVEGRSITSAGLALFFTYWSFYIHRNELVVQLGIQKQVLLSWAAFSVVATVVAVGIRASVDTHPTRNNRDS